MVPDIKGLMHVVVQNNFSLVDPLYELPSGRTLCALDILYGDQQEIKKGNYYMAHRTGFDSPCLEACLNIAGYKEITKEVATKYLEIHYTCRSLTETPKPSNG